MDIWEYLFKDSSVWISNKTLALTDDSHKIKSYMDLSIQELA